jgi:hypothetical protein
VRDEKRVANLEPEPEQPQHEEEAGEPVKDT